MASTSGPTGLRLWSLSTFRVTSFVVAVIVAFHLNGSLQGTLATLDTEKGFGAFLFLWTTTWFATRKGLRKIVTDEPRSGSTVAATVVAGGWNGLYIFAGILVVFLTGLLIQKPDAASGIPIFLLGGLVGGLVAFAVGALVGFLYALTDALVFSASTGLIHWVFGPGDAERRT